MYSYWHHEGRGFQNEYSIGVATTDVAASEYAQAGYERVDRKWALRQLIRKGDAATQIHCHATVDRGCYGYNRFELARDIRNGRKL